jgi:hypothetical protein
MVQVVRPAIKTITAQLRQKTRLEVVDSILEFMTPLREEVETVRMALLETQPEDCHS